MIDVNVLTGCQVRDTMGRSGRVQSVSVPWVKVSWVDEDYHVSEEVYRRSDDRIWTDIELRTLQGWVSMGSILGAKPRITFHSTRVVEGVRNTVAQAEGKTVEESFGTSTDVETEVRYRTQGGGQRVRIFDNTIEASEFVDTLLDEGCQEVLWRTELSDDYWLVDLEGMFESLTESCEGCLEEGRASAFSLKKRRKRRSPGYNPYKYKSKLGPGPRGGTNRKSGEWKCKKAGKYAQDCRHSSGYIKRITIKPGYKSEYNREYRQWRAKKTQRHREAAKRGHEARRARGG